MEKSIFRITSYNVCYTKLLRFTPSIIPRTSPPSRLKTSIVITSYSIHYTKLYEDIFTQVQSVHGHNPTNMPVDRLYHKVIVEDGSVLRTLFKNKSFLVNSFHHQAIKEFGNGLIPTAFSEDGIVEAVA